MKKKILSVVFTLLLVFSFTIIKAEETTDTVSQIQIAPTISVSKGDNNSLVISWSSVVESNEYKVYRSTKKKGKYKLIATPTEKNYTDTKLTYGKTYYYKVKAENSISNKTSKIAAKKVVPNKVENLTIDKSSSKSVKLSWNKVNVTGYEVYRSTDNKNWKKVATIKKANTTSYTNKVETNMKYYYKVRAYKTVKKKQIKGSFSTVVNYTIENLNEGEKLVKNVKMPLWSKDYNLYYTGNKVLASKISNASKILLGVSKYQREHSTSYFSTISKKNVEKEIKNIFGTKVKIKHQSYDLGSCYGHIAKYSKSKYILEGGCGGPGPIDGYSSKVVSVNKYSNRIEVVEKVIFESYPDWDFDSSNYSVNLYTNADKNTLLGTETESMNGDTTYKFENYQDKLDSYKYIFKKSGKKYYFYSVEKM